MTLSTTEFRRSLFVTLALTCSLLLVAVIWNLFALSQSISLQERSVRAQARLMGRMTDRAFAARSYKPASDLRFRDPHQDPEGLLFPHQVALLRFGRVEWAQPIFDPPTPPVPEPGEEAVHQAGGKWVYAHNLGDGMIFLAAFESPAHDRLRRHFVFQSMFEIGAVVILLVFWVLFGMRLAQSYAHIDRSVREVGDLIPTPPGSSSAQAVTGIFQQTVAELKKRTAELEGMHRKERLRAEDVELLAEALCANLEAGYLLFDEEGMLSGVNARARSLLGLVEVPRIGDHTDRLLGERPVLTRILGEARDSRSLVVAEEVPGEGGRKLQAAALPLFNSLHRLKGHLIILRDRTEAYSMARTLRERDALMRLGEMSAGVAHEVRNALGSILAYLRLLKQDHEGLSGDGHFQTLQEETRGLERVVQNLLYYARPLPLERQPVAVSELLDEVASQLREAFPGGKIQTRGGDEEVEADHEALARCLLNLGRNAAEAAREERGDDFEILLEGRVEEDGTAIFLVADNGPGFEGDPASLFTPFESNKPGGTGLGLAIARKIAREHGGELTAESPGELGGAIFKVTLPPR